MANPNPDRSDCGLSFALAVSAAVLFLLLPQRTLHGFDSDWYAALLQGGDFGPARTHIAYLPLCSVVLGPVRALGGGAVHAMWVASALGSALGVFCLHRAARFWVDRATAIWLPVAIALTPACFYFATAAEIHGVFAAGSGAAWWAFARWRHRDRPAAALVLGAACGGAAAIHAFGHLLPPMFVGIAVAQRAFAWRRLMLGAVVIAGAHAGATSALAWWLAGGATSQAGAAAAMLGAWANAPDPVLLLATLWRECLLPFLPWGALAIVGLGFARARPWAIGYAAALALHVPLVCLFLARASENYHERGGYLLATAPAAALAAANLLPRSWLWVGTIGAAALSLAFVAPRWAPRYSGEFVASVTRLQQAGPCAFLVGPAEIEGIRTHLEGVVCAEVTRSMESYFGLVHGDPQAPPLPQWFDSMLLVLGGAERTWIVSSEAQQILAQSADPRIAALWREHVPAHYRPEPLQLPGLSGVRLLRQ